MKPGRTLIVLLSMLIGSVAAADDPPAKPVYVMRHLNTTDTADRDPDLNPVGQERARRQLVQWFKGKPLSAIYITTFKRTAQTAAPLAAERKIAVKVYDLFDTPGLIARLRAEPGPVLVVDHSTYVPDVIEQLGGSRPARLDRPDFGDVWTITAGKTAHDRLP